MNLNQLEYFVATAETLNFTKAAERCFITQTAMSQQIRALEQTVGVPLLIRDKHHVQLTPAGEIYLREARAILERSSKAIKLARTASEGITGALCVGFIRGSVHNETAELLREFHRMYPRVSVSFYRDNMNGLYEALENGRCDIAFNLTCYSRTLDVLDHRFFAAYPLMAVLGSGHSLAGRESVRYAELAREDFIIMQPTGRPRDEAEEVLTSYDRGGFVPNIVASDPEPETVLLMTAAGLGISVLPEYLLRSHPLSQNLRAVPILREDGTAETLDLEVSWRKELNNPAAERFLELLK